MGTVRLALGLILALISAGCAPEGGERKPIITRPIDEIGVFPADLHHGSKHRGVLEVGGRAIPLPNTEMEVIDYVARRVNGFREATVVLAASHRGQFQSSVVIIATPRGETAGKGQPAVPFCQSGMYYREVVANENFGRQDCFLIGRSWVEGFKRPETLQVVHSAIILLEWKRIVLPPVLVSANFYLSDGSGYLRVYYSFNPQMQGLDVPISATFEENPWHPTHMADDPRKVAYMEQVKKWAQSWHPYLVEGFKGSLRSLPPDDMPARLQ